MRGLRNADFGFVGAFMGLIGLSGCAGFDPQAGGGPCLDDSQSCVSQRTALVQTMSAAPTRGWIGESPSDTVVASGVRLFAYQNVRDKLTCAELASGLNDLDAAKRVLASGPAAGQTMLRHNQIKAMTDDVRGSLSAARLRKCSTGT